MSLPRGYVPVPGAWSWSAGRLRAFHVRVQDGMAFVPAEHLAEATRIVRETQATVEHYRERPGWTFRARKTGERCAKCGREPLCVLEDGEGRVFCAPCGDARP